MKLLKPVIIDINTEFLNEVRISGIIIFYPEESHTITCKNDEKTLRNADFRYLGKQGKNKRFSRNPKAILQLKDGNKVNELDITPKIISANGKITENSTKRFARDIEKYYAFSKINQGITVIPLQDY